MAADPSTVRFKDRLSDFTADPRLLLLAAMASIIGVMSTAAAWLLLRMIAVFTNLAYYQRFSTLVIPFPHTLPLWTISIPVIGGLIIGLMARYGSEKIRGHGIPEAIEAILIGQSRIAPKVALLKPMSSAISIGTGGPFGAEGPIIMTGGALGSLFAQLFHLSSAERKTLLVAGAAAGMTAVFGTPIAAILLAVELLLFEWKPRSFIPVAMAAMVAAACRPSLIGAGPLFPYSGDRRVCRGGAWAVRLAGIVAGLQSALMTLCLYGIEDLFRKLPIHWMWWPALGGVAVGIGGYYDPAVLGVGYDNIRLCCRAVSRRDTQCAAAGKDGGLADRPVVRHVGRRAGAAADHGRRPGRAGGALLPFADPGFWALLGMAAILGGTMRAPLTATFFAMELTGNTHILLPLLAASVAAFAITVLLMKRSILTERIARRGLHLTREYSVDPFLDTRVADIMAKPVDTLDATMLVEAAVAFFADPARAPHHKSYPVVDEGAVIAMISRADALRWSREGWTDAAVLKDATTGKPLLVGYGDELVGHLADRMTAADVGRVPILERGSEKLIGLVARRDLLRVRARQAHQEQHRKGWLGPLLSKEQSEATTTP